MVFSAPEFLFLFLPLVLALYWCSGSRLRNGVLLLASLLFYAWGGGELLLLLLVSITGNWCLGLLTDRYRGRSARAVRWTCAATLVLNLGLLGYFKYANFFVAQMNVLLAAWGSPPLAWVEIVLPIGISFYTFQSMSYVFDLARGVSRPLRNPLDFALYVALFPQLIAGPIVRYHELEGQLRQRQHSLGNLAEGAVRFAAGLAKKVILADSLGLVADQAFALPVAEVSTATAWLGVTAYALQIYFDFSGYSDMAIGLGLMFGFRFPENFNRPYAALSITDFWRRWHITLSNWFRDYLYIPLGGSRHGSARTGFNLVLVFLLTGLWHGANWTFIAWGAWHGAWLLIERVSDSRVLDASGLAWPRRLWRRGLTLLVVLFGWALFRAPDLATGLGLWVVMAGQGTAAGGLHPLVAVLAGPNFWGCLLAGGLLVLWPGDLRAPQLLAHPRPLVRMAAWSATLLLALPLALLLALSGSFSPFLYFQF